MRKKGFWVATALIISLIIIPGFFVQTAAQELEWKVAYTPLPGTAYDIFIKDIFPKRIEEATNGKLKIKLLPGVIGVLDILDAVKARRIDGGYILSTSYYGGVVPKWDITALPGLVMDEDRNMPKIINEFLYKAINDEATKDWNSRVATMSWWARSMFFSNTSISKLEDFKGVKFRAHSIGLARLIEQFGGSVVNMPFGELYSSLERKIVDACTSAIPPIMTSGLYERLKYIDPWPGGTALQVVLVNNKSFDSLPADMQALLKDLFIKISREAQDLEIKMARDFVKQAEEKGMVRTKIDQKEMDRYLSAARENVWQKWLKEAGPDAQTWMNKVVELLKK